jgi:cell wall assembly regulator SMI1
MTALSDIEARLADDPADEDAWRSYSSELRTRGDGRAAWMVAPEDQARAEALRDAATWLHLPNWDPREADPGLHFEWRHGFIVGLLVDLRPELLKWPPLDQQFRALIDSPAARLLRSVEIRRVESDTDDHYIQHLAAASRPALRELTLNARDATAIRGELFGHLERLTLRGASSVAPMTMPRLSELTIQSDKLTSRALSGLAKSQLPHLKTLCLAIGAGADVKPKHRPTAADVGAVLATLPALVSLAVRDAPLGDEIVKQITVSSVSARLEALNLSQLELTEVGARALAAAELPRLRSLVLDASAPARDAFGRHADKIERRCPSAAEAARHFLALAAQCAASSCKTEGADGHRRATGLSRWAGLWLAAEIADVGDAWSWAATGVLAWALRLSEDARSITPKDLERLPLQQSIDGFVGSASVRGSEAFATLAKELEEEAREAWERFEDVTALRERLRAIRWLLGGASSWRGVPTWAVQHALPPAEAVSPDVFERVERAWSGLRKRFKEPSPGPVPEARLDAVEREIGHRLPQDLRASYLRHGTGTFPAVGLLSLDLAIAWWREMNSYTRWSEEPKPRASFAPSVPEMREGSWRRGWFPITSSAEDSDFYAVDLEPADAGRVGQVFYWGHEYPGPESVEQESFVAWLEWAATAERFEPLFDEH